MYPRYLLQVISGKSKRMTELAYLGDLENSESSLSDEDDEEENDDDEESIDLEDVNNEITTLRLSDFR